jgi:hypothetical protein
VQIARVLDADPPTGFRPDALCHIRAREVAHLRKGIDAIRGSGNVTGTKTFITLGNSTEPCAPATKPRPR